MGRAQQVEPVSRYPAASKAANSQQERMTDLDVCSLPAYVGHRNGVVAAGDSDSVPVALEHLR
jgi:hypothetical protein